jgi:hypothetical protein
VNAMEQALSTAREKVERRLEAVMSECAGYEECAQACAELAHLRGVGLDALEAAELRELQGSCRRPRGCSSTRWCAERLKAWFCCT